MERVEVVELDAPPVAGMLCEHQLQVGMTLEHAGEDHAGHGLAGVLLHLVHPQHARRRYSRIGHGAEAAVRGQVHAQILGRRPEGLPRRVVIEEPAAPAGA